MDREVFGISGSAARRVRGPLIPAGGIVMLNTTTIPSTMTRFSAADDRFILCAGDTYSAGETGGSASGLSFSSQWSGGHYGSPTFPTPNTNTGGTGQTGIYYGTDPFYAGQHGHNIAIDLLPTYQGIILAKANSYLTDFPADSIVLSYNSDTWGLTRLFTDDYYARAQATIASGGGSITSTSIYSAGYHHHIKEYTTYYTGPNVSYFPSDAGSHTHPYTLSASWLLKAYSVAALTSVSSFDIETGMIIFWESLDPPLGWKICDGTDGTPDLRNYFLKFCSPGNEGTTGGTNIISLTGTLDTYNAIHNHKGAEQDTAEQVKYVYHQLDNWSHSHDVDDTLTQLPPYYGLVPIIKA